MKYEIEVTSKFKKDFKRVQKRGCNMQELKTVIDILSNGEELPEKYKDHALSGNYNGFRECHIQPDWLLIYKIEAELLILGLIRTGTHSDLF